MIKFASKLLLLTGAVLLSCASLAQSEFERRISRFEWPQRGEVDAVLMIPQLKQIVSRFGISDDARLIIRYPGGDEGNEWAFELRNMLVSYGIRSALVTLEPGSGESDTLLIIVTDDR